jgi:hypothetical protein
MILNEFERNRMGTVDLTNVHQDRGKQWADVNKAMNNWIPKNVRNTLTS